MGEADMGSGFPLVSAYTPGIICLYKIICWRMLCPNIYSVIHLPRILPAPLLTWIFSAETQGRQPSLREQFFSPPSLFYLHESWLLLFSPVALGQCLTTSHGWLLTKVQRSESGVWQPSPLHYWLITVASYKDLLQSQRGRSSESAATAKAWSWSSKLKEMFGMREAWQKDSGKNSKWRLKKNPLLLHRDPEICGVLIHILE